MKICDKHWAAMRKAVDDRGMTSLVKSGKENFETIIKELDGEKKLPNEYDPLMGMYWMVTNRALAKGGLYLLTQKEDGSEYCPVCEAMLHPCTCGDPDCNQNTAEKVEHYWTEGVADAALQQCVAYGLIKSN